jgi:hypothetical protein
MNVITVTSSVITAPMPKRILTPPSLSPEEKLARWARLNSAQDRHSSYARGYAAGRRYEKRKLMKLASH